MSLSRLLGMNIYIIVDPSSSKKKKFGDYTAMVVIALGRDRNYYVVEWVRDKLNLKEKADKLIQLYDKYSKVSRPIVAYEEYGLQADIEAIQMVQDQYNYRFPILPLGGRVSKPERIMWLQPLFEGQMIYLPSKQLYRQHDKQLVDLTQIFLQEKDMAPEIPDEMHDDLIDVTSRIKDPKLNAQFPMGPIGPNGLRGIDVDSDRKKYDPLTHGLDKTKNGHSWEPF
jgi:predicted phage terminase large subunit-like protein